MRLSYFDKQFWCIYLLFMVAILIFICIIILYYIYKLCFCLECFVHVFQCFIRILANKRSVRRRVFLSFCLYFVKFMMYDGVPCILKCDVRYVQYWTSVYCLIVFLMVMHIPLNTGLYETKDHLQKRWEI